MKLSKWSNFIKYKAQPYDWKTQRRSNTTEMAAEIMLSELMTIQAGYPFRGAIREIPSCNVKTVQAKDISELGELRENNLIVTDLTGKRDADYLQQGDLLFIAKCAKHTACYIEKDLNNTTSAPSLLRIKPEWKGLINAQYIAWQLNQTPIQNHFKRSAEGSFKISIRKPILAATPIVLPDIATQNTIAKLYAASIKENALLHQLINNRQQQFNAIATDLMKNSSPTGQ